MSEITVCPLVVLLDRIAKFRRAHNDTPPVVVFDLDSTLFCNSGRTMTIFLDWVKNDTRYYSLVKQIPPRRMKWSVDADFLEMGVPANVVDGFYDFWAKRFFSNETLIHDRPMPGAARFVERVLAAGAKVVYATGRDEPNMGEGTRKSLSDYGFPLEYRDVPLILKADAKITDKEFKANVRARLAQIGEVIAFFEDHPEYANTFVEQFPEATVYLMDMPHPADAPAPVAQTVKVQDFLLPEDDNGPYLVVMSGLPATGKSTVAAILAQGLGALHSSTDRIRADLYPSEIYPREVKYGTEAKRIVYGKMIEQTKQALLSGRSAVMDGTFLRNTRQSLAELAQQCNARLVFAKTTCSEKHIKLRMGLRKGAENGDHFSEAHENVYEEMKQKLAQQPDRYLDIEQDPLVTDGSVPLVLFDTGKNRLTFLNTGGLDDLREKIVCDFPLYE